MLLGAIFCFFHQLMAQQKEQEIANLLARETAEKEQIRVEASRQLEAEVAGVLSAHCHKWCTVDIIPPPPIMGV